MSASKYLRLAPELQEQVMRSCEASELLALACSCKILNEIAIDALYYLVDISTHNLVGLFPTSYDTLALAENPDPHLLILDDVEKCLKRQELFIRSMELRPDYGAHVKKFTWTYFSRCDPSNDQPVSDQPTWVALERLTAVKHLDFASMAFQRELDPPPSLFPAAEHIRLTGQMSFAFVRAMLGPKQAEHLVSLELNNLQDLGQFREGENFELSADLSLIPESEDKDGNSVVRHPGNMRTHLKSIEGRCPRLKYLSLRSVGNDDNSDRRWSPAHDEARYQEWASFILSIRFTLERLTIEQGLEPTQTGIGRCLMQPVQYGRPMDDRFVDHLLPVLLDGEFLALQKIHIYGIGAAPRLEIVQKFKPKHHELHRNIHEKLSMALGSGVEIVVKEDATRSFFYRLNGETYDS
ncbi:hypothetical protein ONS95_000273 [Cadophora gregata]|uniref:uncharacterized protein n=1 Tax=Cadophora gregata TaxID=51156 RepID=UPI0026DACACF|nr:uncharacterized protein ONS95_000273 [Cadophora gregata]KAK0128298.1 hypothetical protein ONS95_000273 [Cadophora gregata]